MLPPEYPKAAFWGLCSLLFSSMIFPTSCQAERKPLYTRTIQSSIDALYLLAIASSCNMPCLTTTKWSDENNIKFNVSKCKILSVTQKKNPLMNDYFLGSTKLLRVQEEKDLGVTISNNLMCNCHINSITAKANKLLGLLKRTCPLLTGVKVGEHYI